jgi:hypothetical protein
LLTFGSLLTFEVDRGIDDAWWGPAPGTSADDDPPEAGADEDVDATLDRAGIDQDDLLSLLNEPSDPARSADRPASRKRRRAAKGSARTGGRHNRSGR